MSTASCGAARRPGPPAPWDGARDRAAATAVTAAPPAERSLAAESAAVLAIRGAGVALAFATHVAVARVLGPAAFGSYAYLFALLALFVVPAKLGSDIASVRFVSLYRTGDDRALLGPYLATTLRTVAVTASLATAAWAALMLSGVLRPEGLTAVEAALAAAALPLFAALRTGEGALRGARALVPAFLPYNVVWPVLMMAGLLGVHAIGAVSLGAVLAVQLAAFAVAGGGQLRALARAVRRQGSRLSWSSRAPGALPRTWRRANLVLGLYSLFGLVLGQLDVVTVGAIAGAGPAGRYAAAWRVATLVLAFLTAFNLVFAPRAAELWARRDTAALERLLRHGMSVVAAVTVPAALAIVVLRRPLLELFGGEFRAASGVLVLLCVAQLAIAAGGPAGLLLNMTGHERDSAVVLGTAAVVNLTVNVALVRSMGMVGAAWGTAACTVGWNLALVLVAHRRLGLTPFGGAGRAASRARPRRHPEVVS